MKKMKTRKYTGRDGKTFTVTESSGNVFADLGLPNPEELLLKANLSIAIQKTIKARGLTQAKAGALMGIPQPRVNDVVRGRLENYSVERLMRFLNRLGKDVRITVTDHRGSGGGRTQVAA